MNTDKIVIYNFKVVIWVTAIVGLVLVGDSGFVELQLILNNLTGENLKESVSLTLVMQGIGAPLVDQSIQASVKGLLISGITALLYIPWCVQNFQSNGEHNLLRGELVLPHLLLPLGHPHLARQADRQTRGHQEKTKGAKFE